MRGRLWAGHQTPLLGGKPWVPQTSAPAPPPSVSPPRAFLAAALAQGLCEVLLVVTKEVEEKGSWLRTD